jgi:hypothetical protein
MTLDLVIKFEIMYCITHRPPATIPDPFEALTVPGGFFDIFQFKLNFLIRKSTSLIV